MSPFNPPWTSYPLAGTFTVTFLKAANNQYKVNLQ